MNFETQLDNTIMYNEAIKLSYDYNEISGKDLIENCKKYFFYMQMN